MVVGKRRQAVQLVCGVLVVMLFGLQAASASAVDFSFEKTFGPDGTSLTGFETAGSVAVDQGEETVYLLDQTANVLYKFDLDGNPVDFGGASPNLSGNKMSGLSIGGGLGGRQVAVDSASHIIYVTAGEVSENAKAIQAFHADGEPAIFSAGPTPGTNEIGGLFEIHGVAVDTGGNIYVSGVREGNRGNDINVYSPTGALLLESIGGALSAPTGLAVDTNGTVYALQNLTEVTRLTPSEYPPSPVTTYTVASEKVDQHYARSVAVDPATNRLYVVENFEEKGVLIARVAVFNEDGDLEAMFAGPGEPGELKRPDGIAIGNIGAPGIEGPVARPFISRNPEGALAQVEMFNEQLCICKPTVEASASASVTGDSAVLRARINPNNRETAYWFEYGPEDCAFSICTKVPLDGDPIGHGRKGVNVARSISGLESSLEYHYRVVAVNELGTTNGPSKTFLTQGSGIGFALSDSRVWEMVSPARKYGGTLINIENAAIQASASGDGLIYATRGSIVEQPVSNRLPDPATVLAKRDSNGRWLSDDLTPLHTEASRISGNTPFKLFTSDLAQGLLEPTDDTPLAPEASEQTPYLWSDGTSPEFTAILNPGNVPAGIDFGPIPGGVTDPVRLEGASPDLQHVVIRSEEAALVEGAAKKAIYMWSSGELEALSELPESEGGEVVQGMLGSGQGSVRHAVSDDGSRVFWTPSLGYGSAGIGLPALYLRDTIAGESSRLDVVQPGASGAGPERPAFNIASADGRIVFFTDSQQLTEDASTSGRDLYRCEIGAVGDGLGCVDLTDISAPLEGSGESAEVFDQVPGGREDGTRLFFVARGVLDETPNAEGGVAESGLPNLYLWEEGEGTRFIASLSEEDFAVWGSSATTVGRLGSAVGISAAVSPNGRYLAFTSEQSLTGYENRNSNGAVNTEVFLYDAEATENQLTCLSCNPSGGSAIGELVPSDATFLPYDSAGLWENRWAAGTIPDASQNEGRSLYRPRAVLDNGRAFFNSVDPLVPADSNGEWDVYQYEPVGLGSCAASTDTAAVSQVGNGCIGLLSSGTSEGDAGFLDASPTGGDAFFLTRGRLSVLDHDNELDAYDVRVNGMEAKLEPPQECAGEACQPATGPPLDPTPASESFVGPEASLHCRKGQRKVHRKGKAVCAPKKHKKHKKHKKKQANGNRRALR